MKHLLQLAFLVSITLLLSCTKDKESCWQTYDIAGNEMLVICNKTEAEMAEAFPDPCSYHKTGGEKYCWLVNGVFIKDKTVTAIENYARCRGGGTPVKVGCNECGRWYSRYKRTYRPTSQITYSSVRLEQLCGDTSRSLYDGRQILIKDTPDSLVVLQISTDGRF